MINSLAIGHDAFDSPDRVLGVFVPQEVGGLDFAESQELRLVVRQLIP
jgi:hypothetical protein